MTKPKYADLKGMIISDTAIKQPVFVTMLMLLAVVIGGLAYGTRPVNLLPDIDVPVVTVTVAYPGAGPESVADQVAQPIEDKLSTLAGVDTLTTNASEGILVTIVQFTQATNIDLAIQEVREGVSAIRSQLPQDIQEPVYQRLDPNAAPILTLAITSQGQRNGQQLRQLLENEIVPSIQRAPGVGSTTLTGGLERQIDVNLDLTQLQARGILPSQVDQALGAASTNLGVGDTLVDGQEYNLRTPSVFNTPEDIASVGIPGTPYTVGNVATINDGYADVNTYARINGEDTIVLDIRKQSGTNTVSVADDTLAAIDETFAQYPDLSYTLVLDDAEDVRAQVNGAIEEILLAVVFAILVVWFFFRDWRNTLVTVLGLPVILICTFAGMALFGVTINVISLLALSVSVGLVIDDAIVVRENIFRHIQRGESPIVAASKGTAQVTGSVIAMTLTIIVVFLPVALTSGTTGVIFGAFGFTVMSAITISLIEAFTMAPSTAAHWSHKVKPKFPTIKPGEEHLPDEAHDELGRMEHFYERVVRWTLNHRAITVGIGALVVLLSFWSATGLKFAFFPDGSEDLFGVGIELPPGTPLDETDQWARQVEQRLLGDPIVKLVQTTVGADTNAAKAAFLVQLEAGYALNDVQDAIRAELDGMPGLVLSKPGAASGVGTDVSNRPLQVQVRGIGDVAELAPVSDHITAAFKDVPGLYDVDSTYRPGKPELRYELNQARANDYNFTNRDLATTLRTLVDGDTVATYREAGQDYDVVVRLRPEDRRTIDELGAIELPLGNGIVPLANLVDLEVGSSPTTIRRVDRQAEILVGGNNFARNQNEVLADMQAALAQLQLPPNVRVSFGGVTQDQAEGFTQILLAMALSVTFVYMVLASQLGSLTQPLVIMLAMPLSFMGAFLALTITGRVLDITGMIGMLMLMGLVVKNSILLVDFTNMLRDAGMDKHPALIRAGALRLRPILMTALSLIFASIPSAIGLGEGAELRRGLATVVIGGMTASTFLTLLLVPTAYSLMESSTSRLGRLFRRTPAPSRAMATTGAGATVEVPTMPLAHPASRPLNGEHTNGASTNDEHANGTQVLAHEHRAAEQP